MSDPPLAYLETADGGLLALRPGRRLVARVIARDGERATVAVAGSVLEVAARVPLRVGARVELVVADVAEGRIALRVVEPPQPGERAGIDVSA